MTNPELLIHAMDSADALANRLDGIIQMLMGEAAALDAHVGVTKPPKELVNQFPLEQQPMLYELWLAREEASSLAAWIDGNHEEFEGGPKDAGTTID